MTNLYTISQYTNYKHLESAVHVSISQPEFTLIQSMYVFSTNQLGRLYTNMKSMWEQSQKEGSSMALAE